MIVLNDRVLLNNGTSLISDARASEILVEMGELPEHIRVIKSEASENYKIIFDEDISHTGDEEILTPMLRVPSEEDLEGIYLELSNKRDISVSDTDHDTRVSLEMGFFLDHDLLFFLASCYRLIGRFKRENVIWGVGRGSSCASYILYLLEIHDVNPIKYDIPFIEFSKEND